MSNVTRGEKIMNRLVSEQKLTRTGKDWLVAALDPFHDTQLANLEGWPDTEIGSSVVRCVKKSFSVAVDTALIAAGTNWDCHVILWPFLLEGQFVQTSARLNQLFQGGALPAAGNIALLGGLQAFCVKPGQALQLDQPPGGSTVKIGSTNLDTNYTKGSGRLLGVGFEVHNTTAELYKQGSVCVYRMQALARDPATVIGYGAITAGGNYTTIFDAIETRSPPTTLAEAMLMSGSRQWNAEEGVYQVAGFSSNENPAGPIPPSAPIVLFNAQDDFEGLNNTAGYYYPVPATPSAGYGNFAPIKPFRNHPIHQSGCIFTGLSYQTTLTFNINFFYESFPSNSDLAILALAKPSAIYDPCALELYSRVLQELPVGVPVCENGLGDWFLEAASQAAKYIGPVLAALPHPVAKGAGMALQYLGETGQNYVKRQQLAPPNSWEGDKSKATVPVSVMDNIVNQQKKKDKKKMKKKVAKAKRTAAQQPKPK